MRPPSRIATGLALVVVLAAVLSACGGDEKPANGAQYVALGDSYTAGAGMAPIEDKSCRRSEINYPSIVDKALKIKSFADRSCAGARIGNLEAPQQFKLVRLNEPQLDAVGKDTKLVTIGMGLNDRAISTGLLLICVTPKAPEPSAACRQYLEQPQSAVEAQIRNAAADLKGALGVIARKAPDARIVVVGYPRVVPDEGSCPDLLPVPEAQLVRMRDALKFVNQVWEETATAAGASYVDMYTPSDGHDICSSDPWISGYLGVPGKAVGLHPFPAYAEAVAAEVVELLGKDWARSS